MQRPGAAPRSGEEKNELRAAQWSVCVLIGCKLTSIAIISMANLTLTS
jgi:hypothetical protein